MRILHKNGKPVQVIRPMDPAKALRVAREAIDSDDPERLANLVVEVGDYTFVGWAAEDGSGIVDACGKAIGDLQTGDSFVSDIECAL